MSIALRRGVGLETVLVASAGALDGQGRPSYGTGATVLARVVREDTVVRMHNGDEVRAFATLWFDGAASPLPNADDRITLADGLSGIVVERKAPRRLRSDVVDNVRIKLRRQ